MNVTNVYLAMKTDVFIYISVLSRKALLINVINSIFLSYPHEN